MHLAALCMAGSVAGHAVMMLQASGLQNKNHCSAEQILVSAACKIEREYMKTRSLLVMGSTCMLYLTQTTSHVH